MKIIDKIIKIVKNVFENSELVISDSTLVSDITEWDSLGHINLIMELEEEFNIKFQINEIISITGVNDLLNLIEKKMK